MKVRKINLKTQKGKSERDPLKHMLYMLTRMELSLPEARKREKSNDSPFVEPQNYGEVCVGLV